MPKKSRFILLFVSLFIAFAFAELILRITTGGIGEEVPFSNVGTSKIVIHDDKIGYRLNPDFKNINRYSMRGPEPRLEKDNEVFRILVLSDSLGWDEPSFISHLGDKFSSKSRVEVLNASVPGYSAYQEVLFYKRHLQTLKPDLVLWAYCLNDNHKYQHTYDENARMLMTDEVKYSLISDSLLYQIVSKSVLLSKINVSLYVLNYKLKNRKSEMSWNNSPYYNTAWKKKSWEEYEKWLLELQGEITRGGGNLAIVVFPIEEQVVWAHANEYSEFVLFPQIRIQEIGKKHGVPVLDLFPFFEKEHRKKIKLFRDQLHLTKKGHRIASDSISHFLKNLFPRKLI